MYKFKISSPVIGFREFKEYKESKLPYTLIVTIAKNNWQQFSLDTSDKSAFCHEDRSICLSVCWLVEGTFLSHHFSQNHRVHPVLPRHQVMTKNTTSCKVIPRWILNILAHFQWSDVSKPLFEYLQSAGMHILILQVSLTCRKIANLIFYYITDSSGEK